TAPTPWSIDREVAFSTCQVSCVWPPPAASVAGLAENDRMTGTFAPAPTVTSALRVVVPAALDALSVNAVVAVTFVRTDVPVTGPTPGSMTMRSAPVTDQVSVTWPPPAGSVSGVAANEPMVGFPPGFVPASPPLTTMEPVPHAASASASAARVTYASDDGARPATRSRPTPRSGAATPAPASNLRRLPSGRPPARPVRHRPLAPPRRPAAGRPGARPGPPTRRTRRRPSRRRT